ncbi:MAG: tRNA pseudouridine65 synthase [Oleiphilaceae bacterium]|jgi:tRNA pseudouridine65 synthase
MTQQPEHTNQAPSLPGEPRQETLEIVYQDEHLVAIQKPAGLLVHKSPIDRHETRYAMKILRNQLDQWVYPVHRLDKPTSGLLLFTLDKDTARHVSQQFEQQLISKEYLAVVRGFAPPAGIIDYALNEIAVFKHLEKNVEQKDAKASLTHYQTLKQYILPYSDGHFESCRYSLVKLFPKTGRKHQLRRHLKHISHPIIGDVKHGRGEHNKLYKVHMNSHRLLLAAETMTLTHPVTNERLHIECPLEDNFKQLLARLAPFETAFTH